MSNPFAGTWTYRSFVNNAPPVADGSDPNYPARLEALLFGEGVLTVANTTPTVFEATLSFGGTSIMDLKGTITPAAGGCTAHAHVVGIGRAGSPVADFFYDYDGSLTEHWPNGVNQVPAITGSVCRMKPHGGQPAGLVASFIAVKS